ncbi:ExeM/NucH family extracellular endonuclease [Microbacterium sp. MPKO10]|uniref:ExeM/NucH family extracellular endonuclease n=1 Tax=Microbacterium sp. MPKO10 TaxID=2989818 RepID=UPI002236A24C|nr:ExeM/NucH family extracellular endonuclease [Microbacterium sp. MPKO10]MCW4458815.1 ExeM/NucH family extracellular endonuclease [Microbacterium sp. MPKO10]
MTTTTVRPRVIVTASALLGLACAPLAALPAAAAPDATGVVINEAYLSGGSAGAAFENKFVELYNPTDAAIALDGMTLQYRPAANVGSTSNVVELTGEIGAGGYYLISGGSNGDDGDALTNVNVKADGSLNPSGTNGTILLVDGTEKISPAVGDIAGTDGIVDALGYGTSNTFEGAAAVSPESNQDVRSNARTDGADTDNNADDFTLTADITPQGTGSMTVGDDDEEEEPPGPIGPSQKLTIAEIQGTGWSTEYKGEPVTTTGMVTAAYPEGGFDGFCLQTAGTGGEIDAATHTASDGIFVYTDDIPLTVEVGDAVTINGIADEFYGLTQISITDASDITVDENADAVAPEPAQVAFPATDAERELFEGMLVAPQGDYTVTEVYEANRYGEIALAASDSPLVNPTVSGLPGTPAYQAEVDRAEAEGVTLDDASTADYTNPANSDTPLPYLSLENPVRVGAAVTFTDPVVLDYRFSTWKFQPTHVVTGDTDQPVTFENTREAAPQDVGGDVKLGTFNVLNYFATTGDQRPGCTSFYTDRDGNPITVRDSSPADCQVRGAADAENLERQQAKIVAAINALDADVVSLEEIENSLAAGKDDRDYALSVLVDALNEAAGSDVWAFVPSPAELPENEDVIRTAFIYKPATVELVGEAQILIGSDAFDNAREPDAQAFTPVGGDADDTFVVISNHLKSKGSADECEKAEPGDDNCDAGDGIGGFNGDRTRQAEALVDFADEFAASHDTDKVFLVGDFNSYAAEDPITTILNAGYVDQGAKTGEYTYNYGGAVGSLDYIFASPAADAAVTGQDIWNINSVESVALEYSRYNYNVTNLYADDVYRASDHDPMLVGIATSAGDGEGEEPGDGDNPGGDQDAGEPTPVDDSDLTAELEGGINLPSTLARGETYSVTVEGEVSGPVAVWLHSDPVLLSDGYVVVADDGTVSISVPADAPLGEHQVAVVTESGDVIGWQAVTVTDASDAASGDLPWTGTEALPALVVALLLMALGGAALIARRRRHL